MRARLLVMATCVLAVACEGAVSYVGGDTSTDDAVDSPVDTAIDPAADTAHDTWPDPVEDTVTPDTIADPPWDTMPDPPPDLLPDPPPDVGPDGGLCVSEGCLLIEGLTCCGGLEAARECSVTDPDCPDQLFCIRCGDGSCDPHENQYNCYRDCAMGCDSDVATSYACSPIETHSCFCEPPDCRPECLASSSGDMFWVDPCTGEFIRESHCAGQHAVCDAIGSFSEGWYESETGELIDWAMCAPQWSCGIIW